MTCPICDKKTEQRYRPFCSKRCADLDLGKWMAGDYALASQEPLEPEDAEAVLRAQESAGPKPH